MDYNAGSNVAAGAVNCEGRIVVRVERCGAATALADIVRAVEAAQARAAPVQRLADRVAGGFAAGVLALSTATFAFWAAAGPRLFPQARLSLSPESPLVPSSGQVSCHLSRLTTCHRGTHVDTICLKLRSIVGVSFSLLSSRVPPF